MDTITQLWQVWYVTADRHLLYCDFTATLVECVRVIEARQQGAWAIIPAQ